MPLKNVHYQRLETEDSDGEEDEAPPTHVKLHSSHNVKGNRWNHIENLDDFFEGVYQYQQQHGLAAILLSDALELVQFMFIVLFTAFIVTCLRFGNLWADKVTFVENNNTAQRDIIFGDLIDPSRLYNMHPLTILFLLLAFTLWLAWLLRAVVRFIKFWEIRTFYNEALNISSDLRNCTWADVLARLKEAQREYKMNIRKQELTELDVYHRILRFKNYMVALVNKTVLPSKFHVPFYGEKVFFTTGLKFNYELILFWSRLSAPFRNRFYLRDEYKSASNKHRLVQDLRNRIALLALVNLVFSPIILLYQILYSFFSYAELLKRQPGVFGRRRWSSYGRINLRDFNELDHELQLRLNRAYKPTVKYMDLFTHPILIIIARNIAFITGSLLAVLIVMTVIQEDLLTAHNVLTVITVLGLIVTACRLFIPDENQVWCPAQLMQEMLGEMHYMPDTWKQSPHTVEVYREVTHVFQFTMMYVLDELLSPLVTPFILFFSLRNKASDIVDFLRNFTIEVSGVGDVCSFAEMSIKKHGSPEWLSAGVTRATHYEQAEMGKTEISLMHFSRKNPNWKPGEDGATFMNQLKESVEELHHSEPEESLTFLSMPPHSMDYTPAVVPSNQGAAVRPVSAPGESMQWSIWSVRPSYPGGVPRPAAPISRSDLANSTLDTLQLHHLHDHRKAHSSVSPTDTLRSGSTSGIMKPVTLYSSQASIEAVWAVPGSEFAGAEPAHPQEELTQPLLAQRQEAQLRQEEEGRQDTSHGSTAAAPHKKELTIVEIHDSEQK